ncbi:unnamed protein product [Durusdinium trenchii]|uniref:Uncharacterized protein n=2 Tax=Durusdinium trenchii TaxID=1381693 RepID=A0ABP0Q129_9DINO
MSLLVNPEAQLLQEVMLKDQRAFAYKMLMLRRAKSNPPATRPARTAALKPHTSVSPPRTRPAPTMSRAVRGADRPPSVPWDGRSVVFVPARPRTDISGWATR